jgi:hypothetical protein
MLEIYWYKHIASCEEDIPELLHGKHSCFTDMKYASLQTWNMHHSLHHSTLSDYQTVLCASTVIILDWKLVSQNTVTAKTL